MCFHIFLAVKGMAWYSVRGISSKQGLWGAVLPPEVPPQRSQVVVSTAELVGGSAGPRHKPRLLMLPQRLTQSRRNSPEPGQVEMDGHSFCFHFVPAPALTAYF